MSGVPAADLFGALPAHAPGADALRATLLARLAGDEVSAPPPTASPLDLLTSALEADPASADVVEALRRRAARDTARAEAARARASEEDLTDDAGELLTDATGPDGRQVLPAEDAAEVLDVLRRLHAEVTVLRDRSDRLAAALGACGLCWGEDEACPTCRGRGVPGGRRPQPDLFDQYVRPALRRAAGATTVHPTTRESA